MGSETHVGGVGPLTNAFECVYIVVSVEIEVIYTGCMKMWKGVREQRRKMSWNICLPLERTTDYPAQHKGEDRVHNNGTKQLYSRSPNYCVSGARPQMLLPLFHHYRHVQRERQTRTACLEYQNVITLYVSVENLCLLAVSRINRTLLWPLPTGYPAVTSNT